MGFHLREICHETMDLALQSLGHLQFKDAPMEKWYSTPHIRHSYSIFRQLLVETVRCLVVALNLNAQPSQNNELQIVVLALVREWDCLPRRHQIEQISS